MGRPRTRLLAIGTVCLLTLVLTGLLTLGSRAPNLRLPTGELAPLHIEIDSGGRFLIRDRPVSREKLHLRLAGYADLSRDLRHPNRVSTLPLLILVSESTPWEALEAALCVATSPEVRLWRIWIGLPRRGCDELDAVPTFHRPETLTPPDWRPRPILYAWPDISLSLHREPGESETSVALLDSDYGRGEEGFEEAVRHLRKLTAEYQKVTAPDPWGASLEVSGRVPLSEVLHLVRICLEVGLDPVTLAPVPFSRYHQVPPDWLD